MEFEEILEKTNSKFLNCTQGNGEGDFKEISGHKKQRELNKTHLNIAKQNKSKLNIFFH
jgi:hypothetical protein